MPVEVLENESSLSRLMLICEHASNHVPATYDISEADRARLDDHWGWDPGAEQLVRRLAELEDAPAVLSRFSRLLCDPNRRLDEEELIRTHALGTPLDLNAELDDHEIQRRLATFYHPYHETVDRRLERAVDANSEIFLLSIHTFTPQLGDERREMELGLLFDEQQPYVHDVADALRDEGFDPALNAPYSGKDGLMYSVRRHGSAHEVDHLELEVRNDLLTSAEDVEAIARPLHRALDATVLDGPTDSKLCAPLA